jgi:hypothetical protein
MSSRAGTGKSAIGCLGFIEFSSRWSVGLPPGHSLESAGDPVAASSLPLDFGCRGRSGERLDGLSLTESDPGNTGAG